MLKTESPSGFKLTPQPVRAPEAVSPCESRRVSRQCLHMASPHEHGEGDLVTGSVPMQRTARLVEEEPTLPGCPAARKWRGVFFRCRQGIASLHEKGLKKIINTHI